MHTGDWDRVAGEKLIMTKVLELSIDNINIRNMTFSRKPVFFLSGTTVLADIIYRGSAICIANPFVVNSHVILWNNKLFQITICNHE